MDFVHDLIHLILHFDYYSLSEFIAKYQALVYIVLFLIIFTETGLVVMPFLPGDSLLFAVGLVAAGDGGVLTIWIIAPLLILAAVLGDVTNYTIGNRVGVRLFDMNWRFLKREYLTRTQEFFDKHGGVTIIIARYMPIIRTFTPFVAGLGSMKFGRFFTYCIAGGTLWVCLFSLTGYSLGHIQWVKDNFKLIALGIVATSVVPVLWKLAQNVFSKKTA